LPCSKNAPNSSSPRRRSTTLKTRTPTTVSAESDGILLAQSAQTLRIQFTDTDPPHVGLQPVAFLLNPMIDSPADGLTRIVLHFQTPANTTATYTVHLHPKPLPLVSLALSSATSVEVPILTPPSGKRAPFGWPVFAVPAPGGGDVILRWDTTPTALGQPCLRLTTAIDDRECKRIAVRDAAGLNLGEFDLRFAHALETFSLPLPAFCAELRLTMTTGTSPLWCLAETAPPGFSPHLIANAHPSDPTTALLGHLRSPSCQHTWGWMEGCVLDGLERLAAVYPNSGYVLALRSHLDRFFPADGRLLAETPRSAPHDDAIDNIESTLMFAPLAAIAPDHPWLDRVVAYWRHEAGSDGAVLDGAMLSAEGAYTIAYPMARLARQRGDSALAAMALRQLEIRRAHLWHEDALWLRWYPANGERTFRNWARGVTWHFLGTVRTAQELAGDPGLAPLFEDIQKLAELALRTQKTCGLWANFLDSANGLSDTSGSAGIAAALAISAREGWLDPSATAAAGRAWHGLLPHITADGRLGGVAQSNRGGEELQRSDYRVLSAMGAGLTAQLHSALTTTPSTIPNRPIVS